MRILFATICITLSFLVLPSHAARIEAKVDPSQQKMKVYKSGRLIHSWRISSGRRGYSTPTGRWGVTRMHRKYYSRKYNNAPMPNSIFFYRGYAIHGTNHVRRLGRPASHGCIRLAPSHARALFNLVQKNGRNNFRVQIVR